MKKVSTINDLKTLLLENRGIPIVVNIVCVALLLVVATKTVMKIYGGTQTLNVALPVKSSLHSIVSMADLHLLGVYHHTVSIIPNTSLPLKLYGTIVSMTSPKHSYALIAVRGNQIKVYKPEDQIIPGDAVLKKINNNGVILSVQGQLQHLNIPLPKQLGQD